MHSQVVQHMCTATLDSWPRRSQGNNCGLILPTQMQARQRILDTTTHSHLPKCSSFALITMAKQISHRRHRQPTSQPVNQRHICLFILCQTQLSQATDPWNHGLAYAIDIEKRLYVAKSCLESSRISGQVIFTDIICLNMDDSLSIKSHKYVTNSSHEYIKSDPTSILSRRICCQTALLLVVLVRFWSDNVFVHKWGCCRILSPPPENIPLRHLTIFRYQ